MGPLVSLCRARALRGFIERLPAHVTIDGYHGGGHVTDCDRITMSVYTQTITRARFWRRSGGLWQIPPLKCHGFSETSGRAEARDSTQRRLE